MILAALKDVLPYLGGIGGVGALITAIGVVWKVGVQKTDVKIASADKVLVGQGRWIDDLEKARDDLGKQMRAVEERCQKRITDLEARVDAQREALEMVTDERDALKRENHSLKWRIASLEQRVEDLSRAAGTPGPRGDRGDTGARGAVGREGREGREGERGERGFSAS